MFFLEKDMATNFSDIIANTVKDLKGSSIQIVQALPDNGFRPRS
jgi:hypothetical protein